MSGQLHAQAALPPGKESQYPLDRRLGRPQSRSERHEVKILLPPRLDLRPLGRPARSQSLYRLRYMYIYIINNSCRRLICCSIPFRSAEFVPLYATILEYSTDCCRPSTFPTYISYRVRADAGRSSNPAKHCSCRASAEARARTPLGAQSYVCSLVQCVAPCRQGFRCKSVRIAN
jgi:hypothetical protein